MQTKVAARQIQTASAHQRIIFRFFKNISKYVQRLLLKLEVDQIMTQTCLAKLETGNTRLLLKTPRSHLSREKYHWPEPFLYLISWLLFFFFAMNPMNDGRWQCIAARMSFMATLGPHTPLPPFCPTYAHPLEPPLKLHYHTSVHSLKLCVGTSQWSPRDDPPQWKILKTS